MTATRKVFWHLHAGLLDRLEQVAEEQGRAPRKVVEHALANYLAVPLAYRERPEQPCEMCPVCERGVLHNGGCRECGWHREARPWHRRTRARDTKRRRSFRTAAPAGVLDAPPKWPAGVVDLEPAALHLSQSLLV